MKNYRLEKLSPDRRLVWDLLSDTDSYYLNHQIILIDFCAVEKARAGAAANGSVRPSYTAFMFYAISRALPRFPAFNSYLRGFPSAKLAFYKDIDICFTMEREKKNGGKYVALSILKNCEHKTFSAINGDFCALKSADYEKTDSYRNRSLFLRIPNFIRMLLFRLFYKPFPSKMREIAGTCAFTSVGKYGVDFTTPLSPKSMTFSLGRVRERPAAVNGSIEARLSAYVTLTYDHRIADGAECAALGSLVKEIIETADWNKIIGEK
ncbi:MAG: hypothetical protein A2008_11985 [Candidatus Wallbacteria bacterium GWC2_49_35]|uniref:2-oxoacid dehydrogenase acyltransferase catalytic domain-containing protein n=1 Tax=Candidatus Wallbacteria bacterium GWC2_49_35 TaxID=1817813 RepID=A0A1F7WZT8_9BACT|nr:MAG: hypothetical protein A2008_11985 [Candidatus Wallbacteria bacterium GWC2_49_35]HBC76791.1 hypothetical protein [Candidatus Wallbacteria bacterium]